MIVPLWGPGLGYKSANVSKQRRLNLYIEPQKDQDKTPLAMYQTHGLTLFTSGLGASIVRGARSIGNTTYLVAGNTLYSMNNAGVLAALGTIGTSSGRVSMSDNGTQLILVDGGLPVGGYILTLATNAFAAIADPNFPDGATTVGFLGGFFIVNKAGTGQFWWSNVYDGSTWNALQFATAEYDPDNLLAVSVTHGELLLWGERTIEVWALSGDSNVFRRLGGAAVEWGLASVFSIDRFGDAVIYLAKNRMGQYQVAVLNGYTSTPVSTPEVEFDLNMRPSPAGATAYSYLWFGHPMYQINFPDKSYLYDGLADAWSEVGSGSLGGTVGRHYGEVRFELLSKPYVSDYRNGNIYSVDPANYTDNGDPITSQWTTKHTFGPELDYVTMDELQIDLEAGIGLATGQGSDPQLMLEMSRDGGHTWSNQRFCTMGPQGQYTYRSRFLGLGTARDFTGRITITDPVKRAIVGANLRVR